MKIGIVTDNSCNLSKEKVKELDIYIASLYICREEKYERVVDVEPEIFYDNLGKEKYIPKTSQPSVADFIEIYKKALEKYDKIISVHLPEKLSGTVNSANMAANQLGNDKIFVVDSNTSGSALGFLVEEIKMMIEEGKEIEEIIEFSKSFYRRTAVYFTVGDLDYLSKGGRIGKAKALIGGMLKLKPILALKEGEIVPEKNVRGLGNLIDELTRMATEHHNIKKLVILYTDNKEPALLLYDELLKSGISKEKMKVIHLDIVLGVHLGPDAMGVICHYEY